MAAPPVFAAMAIGPKWGYMEPRLDEIGKWSEIKLDIITAYANAYTKILANQPRLYHAYIDGFAGAGLHIRKSTGQTIRGSPLNVASVTPRFKEYHLCELDPAKAAHLKATFAGDGAFHVHPGDCNKLVPGLLRRFRFEDYRRAFCVLDPYGLQLEWQVIELAGKLRSIDLLLHFPIMDMNRNVLWHDPGLVTDEQAARLTRFWGDESWRQAAYSQDQGLFGVIEEKTGNEAVVEAFAMRLHQAAGFKHVAQPLPMKNSTNAVVYYLFFASQNPTAHKIISAIFRKHRN